jgi:hypothetical protein
MLPKSIHAFTAKEFELKVMFFIVALDVNLWVVAQVTALCRTNWYSSSSERSSFLTAN